MKNTEVRILDGEVVIYTPKEVVTVNLDGKRDYLVAVNPHKGGDTKVIRR